jgi:hypothetical protein
MLNDRCGGGRSHHGGTHSRRAADCAWHGGPLDPYAAGCTDVDRELALAIVRDPDSYYVNEHNASYPAGALRGKVDGSL